MRAFNAVWCRCRRFEYQPASERNWLGVDRELSLYSTLSGTTAGRSPA
jgi:hypothetical protein